MESQRRRFLTHFGPLFITSLAAWSVFMFLSRGDATLGPGSIAAGVLAYLGTLVTLCRDAAREARRRRAAALTTAQEFPAIPMPLYLVPLMPPLYEADLAAG